MKRKLNTILFASACEVPPGELLENIDAVDNNYVRDLYNEAPDHFRRYSNSGTVFTDDLAPVEYFTDTAVGKIFELIE